MIAAMNKASNSIQFFLAAAMALMLIGSGVSLAGDPYAGEVKAQTCLTCHGKGDATTGAATPIISGQYSDYIAQSLRDYQSGVRNHPVMSSFVASLTETDIRDLAAYYSEMDSKLFTPKDE